MTRLSVDRKIKTTDRRILAYVILCYFVFIVVFIRYSCNLAPRMRHCDRICITLTNRYITADGRNL